eukprot:scaffold5311_cov120-Isochrysis_galbana.AAC.2
MPAPPSPQASLSGESTVDDRDRVGIDPVPRQACRRVAELERQPHHPAVDDLSRPSSVLGTLGGTQGAGGRV